MAKRKKLRARAPRIALWRRQVFWIWQQERQKRRGSGGAPPGEDAPTLQFNVAANSQLLVLLEDF